MDRQVDVVHNIVSLAVIVVRPVTSRYSTRRTKTETRILVDTAVQTDEKQTPDVIHGATTPPTTTPIALIKDFPSEYDGLQIKEKDLTDKKSASI